MPARTRPGPSPAPLPLFVQPMLAIHPLNIAYSTGIFHQPNRPEQECIDRLSRQLNHRPDQRFVLVLPADDRCLRRFLRALVNSAPQAMRNAVVVTGEHNLMLWNGVSNTPRFRR